MTVQVIFTFKAGQTLTYQSVGEHFTIVDIEIVKRIYREMMFETVMAASSRDHVEFDSFTFSRAFPLLELALGKVDEDFVYQGEYADATLNFGFGEYREKFGQLITTVFGNTVNPEQLLQKALRIGR